MTDVERRAAARQFASDWQGKGDEKQETQRFWLSLLQNVCGVAQPTEVIEFEKRVEVDNSEQPPPNTLTAICPLPAS